MANLFKTRFVPNPDGTNSTTAITNANTAFVHTYLGDDSTGNGTREVPFKSAFKANQKAGVAYIVFRGVIDEAFSTSKTIIGDDINQNLITSNFTTAALATIRVTLDKPVMPSGDWPNYRHCIYWLDGLMPTYYFPAMSHLLFKCMATFNSSWIFGTNYNNCTYSALRISNASDNGSGIVGNSIVIKSLDHKLTYPYIKNTVFPSTCIFRYNGVNLIQPNFTNDSKENISLLRAAYVSAGMTVQNALKLFPKDSFGNEQNLIMHESRCGGSHPNIFNEYEANANGILSTSVSGARTTISLNTISGTFPSSGDIFLRMADGTADVFTYTSWSLNAGVITFTGASQTLRSHLIGEICTRYGDVLDFDLNPNPLNEALHASDVGGYVGCFPPAIAANNWGSIINVNADGSDDVVAGLLLQSDFTFSHASGQTWNRIQGAVEKIEKPGKFKGLNCDTLDGTPWGDYFGKKQNLVSNVALNATDALEPNTRYKVANTADHTNYAIVIYKGVQYPPDFFFVTDATNLTFDLLNAGSGSVVRKVFATPLESGEIIPFDDYTTPSAFPRFSAPFMGDVLMLFHKIGVNINQPVLFSEVTNDKIAYYANWAVTNADQEFVTIAADTVNYYYKIPILTYYKKELNAHFDANYDQ